MQRYKGRFLITTVILIQAFLILAGRMWYVQIIRGDEFEKFSLNNRIRSIRIPAPRGRILDRRGRELVVNRPSFNVYVLPEDIKDRDSLAVALSLALGMEHDVIKNKIEMAFQKNRHNLALIAQDISRNQLAFLEARRSSLPGLVIEVDHLREYMHGKVGAPFLGYMGKITESELKLHPDMHGDDLIGKSGMEKNWEDYLHGKDGFIQRVTDAFGREVRSNLFQEDIERRASIPGADVILSIDIDLQIAAEEALGDKYGAVVAMDPRTGQVLALVSHPTFDPRDFIKGVDSKEWTELVKDPSFPLVNRATQGVYPPGSIFKIVTAAAALEEGVIDTTTPFYCPGVYNFGKKTFRCWRKGGHGRVYLHQAIVGSCDVYFYNVARRLGIDRLARYIKGFGFGVPTGIDLSEKAGTSPSREWKSKTFKKPWYDGETIVTGIGQGYVSATPLQIAVMTAAVANGGMLLKPQIVKEVISPQGKTLFEYNPQENGRLPVEKRIMDIIRDALVGVVNEPHGTGKASKLDRMVVAGKTGTSQVVAQGSQGGKYLRADQKDHAWFTSYAPAEKPEVVVTVFVEHGGMGGEVAAPIAKQILEAYLKLKDGGSV
ncbi:MAG: penicillin-binding protein 2 [Ignavibacteriales bacterium]